MRKISFRIEANEYRFKIDEVFDLQEILKDLGLTLDEWDEMSWSLKNAEIRELLNRWVNSRIETYWIEAK